MNSSANFITPNGNVSGINQSQIQRRTNNNISIGDESFNNLSIGNILGTGNAPNPIDSQRIIIRRVPRPTVAPTQETVQITTNPRVTLQYVLEYESLQKVCQSKYYTYGDVSNSFITEIIKQAGGSNQDSVSQNIFARLSRWVNNKDSNTRTKVADSLAIYSKGNKNHNLKVYMSDSQVFFGNEFFSPALLSLFLSQITYENYQNDNFIKEFVDSCMTGEETQWYADSVPLIKRLISILNDYGRQFDSGAKMRVDAHEAFQFTNSALYLNAPNSSQ
ncbi:hypothetical protein ACTFIR_005705 [Dictyostelium discoideum]